MTRSSLVLLVLFCACGNNAPPPDSPKPEPTVAQSATATAPSASASASAVASSVPSAAPSAVPSAAPAPAVPADSVALYLADTDPKTSTKPGATKIGCDEYLVPKIVKVAGADKKAQLQDAMTKLLAEMKEKLTTAVTAGKDGGLVVDVRGKMTFGGTCDAPRKLGQITKTAEAFGPVKFTLNGSAKSWDCLGDESGKCK